MLAMSDYKQQAQLELRYRCRRSRYLGKFDWLTFRLKNFSLIHHVFLGEGGYRHFVEALYLHLQGKGRGCPENSVAINVTYFANPSCNVSCSAGEGGSSYILVSTKLGAKWGG
jgi:hypothetical protein